MQPHLDPQSTARDWSHCAICGTDSAQLVAKDFHTNRPGYAWVLGAVCRDVHGCAQRRQARDAHLDERWSLTCAGRQALAAAEKPEVA